MTSPSRPNCAGTQSQRVHGQGRQRARQRAAEGPRAGDAALGTQTVPETRW